MQRYYGSYLNRWTQPDSIVPEPGNPQDLNRYTYVRNNPIKHIDPTGHFTEDEIMGYFGVGDWASVISLFEEGGDLAGRWGWLAVLRTANLGDQISFMPQGHGTTEYSVRRMVGLDTGSEGNYTGYFEEGLNGQLFVGLSNATAVNAKFAAQLGEMYKLDVQGDNYSQYFDARTAYVNSIGYDPSAVDWAQVGLDSISAVASMVTLGSPSAQLPSKTRKALQVVEYVNSGYGVASALLDAYEGDWLGFGMDMGGFIPGPIGVGFSFASVYYDLHAGWTYAP